MPLPPFDTRSPEYQAILRERQLYKLYGPEGYADYKQALSLLDRLEKRALRGDFTHEDCADYFDCRAIFRRLTKYDPSQPRVPAGSSTGGEWTDAGGGARRTVIPSSRDRESVGRGLHRVPLPKDPLAQQVAERRVLRPYPRTFNTSPATHATLDGHQKVTLHHEDGSTETRVGGSQAWRNNNPGNMRPGNFARRHGSIGENNGMAVFPDAATGHEASVALTKGPTYSSLTVNEAIARRSPNNENDTLRLQQEIPKRADLSGNRIIGELNLEELDRLMEAIYQFEGWQEGVISKAPPVKK